MFTMITVRYQRIPMAFQYRTTLVVDAVDEKGQSTAQKQMQQDAVPLEDMATALHLLLQEFPQAKVTMIQEPTRDLVALRSPSGYELSEDMVGMIRKDVDKAKELFAPMHRVVKVGGTVPRSPAQPEEGEDNAG